MGEGTHAAVHSPGALAHSPEGEERGSPHAFGLLAFRGSCGRLGEHLRNWETAASALPSENKEAGPPPVTRPDWHFPWRRGYARSSAPTWEQSLRLTRRLCRPGVCRVWTLWLHQAESRTQLAHPLTSSFLSQQIVIPLDSHSSLAGLEGSATSGLSC